MAVGCLVTSNCITLTCKLLAIRQGWAVLLLFFFIIVLFCSCIRLKCFVNYSKCNIWFHWWNWIDAYQGLADSGSHWRHKRDWISSSSRPRTLMGVSDWRCLVRMRSQRDQELRALPRSLCEHQRSKMIRRIPIQKKRGQRRMTGAAHTVECHQKLRANVPNEREKTKQTVETKWT